jgi:hypothetical protein
MEHKIHTYSPFRRPKAQRAKLSRNSEGYDVAGHSTHNRHGDFETSLSKGAIFDIRHRIND